VAELRQNIFEASSGSDSEPEHPEEVKSTGSGDTEGPEEENHSSGDDAGGGGTNWPWSNHEECVVARADGDAVDRQHARDFVKILSTELVPNLLKLRSSLEVDESLQEFASNICQQNSMTYSDFDQNLTAINADGIYLATYSALLLSLQLMRAGHYSSQDVSDACKRISNI
jgi:brefeldin A-inhibited guanine nucleotide-exchange protein 3